ncbi:hypothetical protein EUTSA_v10005507mg [Eutrema salsugineum]|uniref:mRNA guanylyltransferase n=1 Tax=Eutrema salsugineum TaxID=72664 RepID=V4MLH4_EUTSA|nr:hypothetical protein EUTSA_v10005507mg [Eutrema salsugineum]
MYSEEAGASCSSSSRKRHLEDRIGTSEEKRKRMRDYYPRDQNTTIIPHGWLHCPRFGHEIGCIVPSKVPLSDSTTIWVTNTDKKPIGMVIDLTNTARYYDPSTELRQEGIHYVKIRCTGRDSVPDYLSVNTFVNEVNQFEKHNLSNKYVLVHCTHGHNRTGFIIVHYLMRTRPMMSVTQALKTFSDARPPGIYKPDYIDALYSFYHEVKPLSAVCPTTPEWKRSENEFSPLATQENDQHEENVKKNMTNDDVLGDEIPWEEDVCYRKVCYELMNIKGERDMKFPGLHPRYYYATWKADGTRYMMLLTRKGCYLIDRKFRFRKVKMRFPCRSDHDKVHHYTLLDGEMVVDNFVDGKRQERNYLVYDLVAINGESVTEWPFSERWELIDREVIKPRSDEKKVTNHRYIYEQEPFGIRRKAFCLLSAVEEKLFNKLIPSLPHESDGLIFQGYDDTYVYRENRGLLKWKFVDTVDFLFEMGRDGSQMLFLYEHGRKKLMEGYSVEFRGDGWDHPASYSGKLLECSWDKEKDVWVTMRVRVDKSEPNGVRTALSVIKSINDGITKEVFVQEIREIIRLPMYVERIRMDTQAYERRKHGNCRA